MPSSRKIWRGRSGALATTIAVIAAGGAISGGIVSGTFDSPDINPPSAFLTAPASAATVSGASVTVSAACGDNVGCAGVQFKLDDVNLGAEDTSAPFSITWDSTGSTDGAHTLSAVARDAAGNTTTTTSRAVTVSNAGGAGSTTWTTANLWIDSNGGTCSRQVSVGAYSDAGACSSLATAQAAASAGDRVVVKCGAYGAQTLSTNARASVVNYYAETYVQATTAVDVLTATSCVTVDKLTTSIDKVHFHGIQATAQGFENVGQTMSTLITLDVAGTNTDVLVDGWRGHAVRQDGAGITFSHMEIGNANYCSTTPEERDADQMIAAPPDGDAFTNSVAHDWYDGSGTPDGACGQGSPGGHDDCIQSNGGNNQTISGDLFYKCGSSSVLQWGEFSGGLMGTITVQNNYFGSKPTEFNILSMGQGHCAGLIIRNNDFEDGAVDNNGGCIGSATESNNIFLATVGSCGTGFSGSNNVFPVSGGTTCGSNPKQCTPSFVAGAPSGFSQWEPKLNVSDTCAVNYSAASFPANDFYGVARPIGATSDAGASEVG